MYSIVPLYARLGSLLFLLGFYWRTRKSVLRYLAENASLISSFSLYTVVVQYINGEGVYISDRCIPSSPIITLLYCIRRSVYRPYIIYLLLAKRSIA